MTADPSLHELWALPLEEQQARRTYKRWDTGREEQLKKDNAAPDFPKVGRFYLLKEPRSGTSVIVDPERPWNDAKVFEHPDESEARRWAELHAKPVNPIERPASHAEETASFIPHNDWDDVEEIAL
jgi:hypothetical protein